MSAIQRLDAVCELTMGQAPIGESYNAEKLGLPLIAGAGDFGDFHPEVKKFTTSPGKVCKAGDIVLGIRATIGVKVTADREYCLGRGVAGLRTKSGLDDRYLWHWLTHMAPSLAAKAKGATFKQVNREDIGELPIGLPSQPKQKRIAEVLDRADALRAKRRAALAQLDSLTQSIFLDMFGDPGANPKGWPVSDIVDVCELIVDCVNRTAPVVAGPTPFKMIRTTNVKEGKVNLTTVRYVTEEVFNRWNRRATPRRGDMLLTREAPVGESGMIESNDSVFLGQRLMLYRANCERMTPEYLLASFRGKFLQQQFNRDGSGSTVKHLPLPACRSFQVHVPPISLQREFAYRITAIEALKTTQRAALAELDALFASLQHRAFRDEL